MIIKKKILSNELIKRNYKNIKFKDRYLFKKDLQTKTGESYIYLLKNVKILNDGKINLINPNIISDYLGFKSLSKFVLFKKFLLISDYFFKTIKQNIFIHNIVKYKSGIIIYNRNSHGYFHWILDTLPKIIYVKKKYQKNLIILPNTLNIKFVKESLQQLEIKYVFLKKQSNCFVKNVTYIGDLYPSGSPRYHLLKKIRKKINTNYNYKGDKRLFISRNKSIRRKITNENEIHKILKTYKFKILYNEDLKFNDQVREFSSAKYVIGLHGAGLSNILWMKKNSNLIELRPEKDLYLNCYYNLAKALNINYNYLICKKEQNLKSSKYSNFKIDVKSFEKELIKIINNEKKKNKTNSKF
tara:strand:- start:123 stop:1190 length:1068 start_codon:yes stop_codon:yes gene_type:complete